MRILAATLPFMGHFRPLVPIIRVLENRGHQVCVASAPSFGTVIERYGFRAVAIGDDRALPLHQSDPDPLSGEVEALVGLHTNLTTQDLNEFAIQWKPHTILREGGEFASFAVAECHEIPHYSAGWILFETLRAQHAGLFEGIARQLSCLGLSPDRFRWQDLYRFCHFEAGVPNFYRAGELPTTATFFQADNPLGPEEDACDWYDDLQYRKSILVSFGTVALAERSLLRFYYALRSLDTGRNIIFSSGGHASPIRNPRPSNNVISKRDVPHSWILKQCELVICHGSINTVRESIYEGVPLLLVPQFTDHFFVSDRISSIGLGKLVGRNESAAQLRDVVLKSLSDAQLITNVHATQAAMHCQPAISSVAEAIERGAGL